MNWTHWGSSCSLQQSSPFSTTRGTWWCSSGWGLRHSGHLQSNYRSPGGKTASGTHWRTSWVWEIRTHQLKPWDTVWGLSEAAVEISSYQNSPSSIWQCRSSRSDGSISSHSGELKPEEVFGFEIKWKRKKINIQQQKRKWQFKWSWVRSKSTTYL